MNFIKLIKFIHQVSKMVQKKDFSEVKDLFRKHGCTVLDNKDVYKDKYSKLNYRCKCGREFVCSFNSFRASKYHCCRFCAAKIKHESLKRQGKTGLKYSYETAKKMFKDSGCKLLSPKEDYTCQTDKLRYICNCGQESTITLLRFMHGQRCRSCGISKIRKSYNTIKTEFEKRNCKLLTPKEEYVDTTNVPVKYQCKCGKITHVTYNDFTQKKYECSDCALNSKKKDFLEISIRFEKEGCELLTTKEEYVNNHTALEYRCYCGRQDTINWASAKKPTWKGCKKCKTDNERHDYQYVKSYFKEQRCKLLSKNYENNHSVLDYVCQCGNKSKINFKNFKRGERCKICKVEKFRETCTSKYGVDNPSKDREMFAKAMDNSPVSYEYTLPSGKTLLLQGYESYAIDYILDNGIDGIPIHEQDLITGIRNVPIIKYKDSQDKTTRNYYPDIYIPKLNMLIEVKSPYFLEKHKRLNKEKMNQACKQGYKVRIFIMKDGKMIEDIQLLLRKVRK